MLLLLLTTLLYLRKSLRTYFYHEAKNKSSFLVKNRDFDINIKSDNG